MVWEKELLFSDDSQHLARVAQMSQAQRKHADQAQVWMFLTACAWPAADLVTCCKLDRLVDQ